MENRKQLIAKWIVPLLAILVFAIHFFNLEDIGIDYWDTYIAAPATFIADRPCEFVGEDGLPSYDIKLKGSLPQDLVGKDSFGIISKDQRIGAGVTFAIPYLVFGMSGFRIFYAAFAALAFLFAYLLGQRLFDKQWQAIMLGLIIALNPFMLGMNRLNANHMSVAIMTAFAAMLFAKKPRWLLLGLVYGALGGIRNEAIMIVPALCLFMLATKQGRRGIFVFGAGALGGIAPYLAWNKFAFGKALIHASQYSDFEGHRPMFDHSFLWLDFKFNGLFNWPFHEQIVRTPHYPLPTFMTLPLVLTLCFGVILMALGLIGLFKQWKVSKVHFGFWGLWIVFVLALFLPQENWEVPKTTFGSLAIPAMAVFMVYGAKWVIDGKTNWRRWATLVAVVLVLEVAVAAAGKVQVPVDERWYVRFPKAKLEAGQTGCLNDLTRREWMYFHTDECKSELDEQRAKITRGNLLPGLFYPLTLSTEGVWGEWGKYNPEIFNIWEKIYGY